MAASDSDSLLMHETADGEYMSDGDFDELDFESDEEDELQMGMGFSEPSSMRRQQSYEVLDEEQIKAESNQLVKDVQEMLDLPNKSFTVALLRHHKWNRERLIERYMDSSEKVLEEVGLTLTSKKKDSSSSSSSTSSDRKKHTCKVCMEKHSSRKFTTLACGHKYCKSCWSLYLSVKLDEGQGSIFTTCMHTGCKELVPGEIFKKMLSKDEYKRYEKFAFRSFVDDNAQVKWCPAPNCTNAVRVERKNRRAAVICGCTFRFCFRCADYDIGDHAPCTCEEIEQWMQKASDESENVNWMLANTKKCPNCRTPIEKNGGCMHMRCSSRGCKFEFCWLCRGPWKDHGSHTGGYYNCNKYDKSEAKKEDLIRTDAKTELEVYMFFYHRYESHRNAMKIADQQRKTAERKGVQLQEIFDVRAADTKFLQEAAEQLIDNRRVLQYSYVYGYYLKQKPVDAVKTEKNLFEYLQEDLEKHTNYLSELYEKPIEKMNDYQQFIAWKEEVTNYSLVTKKFLDNFVQGVGTLTNVS